MGNKGFKLKKVCKRTRLTYCFWKFISQGDISAFLRDVLEHWQGHFINLSIWLVIPGDNALRSNNLIRMTLAAASCD